MIERSPKVLIVLDNEFDSDIRVKNEVDILKNAGIQITILCFQFDENVNKSYTDLNVVRVPIKRNKKNQLFFIASWTPFYKHFWSKQILKELRREEYNLIYSHDLYMIGAARHALNQFEDEIPFIIDLHEHYAAVVGTYSWTKGFLRRQLSRPWNWYRTEKKDLQYPDLCITLSNAFSSRLSKLTNRSMDDFFAFPNISQLPPLLDLEIDLPFSEEDVVFLYYGAIADRRGIFDLFEAFLVTVEKHPQSKLLLIGPTDKSDKLSFDTYLNNPKLQDNVHYIPWIESKYWRNYAELSDFCLAPFHVNPQHNSGVANKIFQYLQAGKFIIASNCTPQKNLICDYSAGIIFDNQVQLVQSIVDCTLNIDKYKEQGKKAAILFKQQNVFEENAKSYIERINKLLKPT